jgi:homopolymeric O-antigen transport system permease protein
LYGGSVPDEKLNHMNKNKDIKWNKIIKPQRHLLEINFKDLWLYRELLYMFVKRDIITVYKQTIFGPIWYFVQPILTMLVYLFIFSIIARIPTDGVPAPLFYLSGIIMWNYFSESFNQTSDTFFQNAAIFGKVYFPRMIVPLSKVISALIKFAIQSLLFLIVYFYFNDASTEINTNLLILIPFLVILMGLLGCGTGIIFSSLTTKYRDLKFVITFGMQLMMYATPIIYPMSIVPNDYQYLILWNPMAHIVEAFRYILLGSGEFTSSGLLYTAVFAILVLFIGIVVFNKAEQKFMDTI